MARYRLIKELNQTVSVFDGFGVEDTIYFPSTQDVVVQGGGMFSVTNGFDLSGNTGLTGSFFIGDFENDSCEPPIVANNDDEFFAELALKFFSSTPVIVPIDRRIIKFVKDENGNVLLKKLDNTLITSFNPAQNLLRIPEEANRFKIQSLSAFASNPLVLDYTQVNCDLCEPYIDAQDFNGFLVELSKKFFFLETDSDSGTIVIPNRFVANSGYSPRNNGGRRLFDYITGNGDRQIFVSDPNGNVNSVLGMIDTDGQYRYLFNLQAQFYVFEYSTVLFNLETGLNIVPLPNGTQGEVIEVLNIRDSQGESIPFRFKGVEYWRSARIDMDNSLFNASITLISKNYKYVPVAIN